MEDTEETSSESPDQSEISLKDKCHYVKITALFLGLAFRLPYAMIVTITGYWDQKLRNLDDNSTDTQANERQLTDISYINVAFNVPNAVCVILATLIFPVLNHRLVIFGGQAPVVLIFTILSGLDIDYFFLR